MTQLHSHTAPVYVSAYELVARDAHALSAYYQQVIGLTLLKKHKTKHLLGIGDTPLLTIHHNPQAELSLPSASGLFHAAFLVPTRADLAHVLSHTLAAGTQLLGAADHLVSEAIYFTDPKGNGIEIYADKPYEQWPHDDNKVAMDTLPLNTHDVLAASPKNAWHALPDDTVIGHIHLQVGALLPQETFYKTLIGFDITQRIPGATFFATGGYHHHLATNTWASEGAEMMHPNSTGLYSYTLTYNDANTLTHTLQRFKAAEKPITKTDAGFSVTDPSGVTVLLQTK